MSEDQLNLLDQAAEPAKDEPPFPPGHSQIQDDEPWPDWFY